MLHLYHDHHPDMCDRVSVTPEPRNTRPVWGRTETWSTDNRLIYYSSRWQLLAWERMDIEIRLTYFPFSPAGYTQGQWQMAYVRRRREDGLFVSWWYYERWRLFLPQTDLWPTVIITGHCSPQCSEQVPAWQSCSLVSGTHNSLLNI